MGLGLLSMVSQSFAQDNGFAINRFDPSERGSDWFALESLDLRGHGRFAVGVVGDWAKKPLVAYDAEGDEVAALIENQVYGHWGASAVFWDRVRVGMNLPILFFQNGDNIEVAGVAYDSPGQAAAGDLRLGSDVRIVGEYGSPATLAAGVFVHMPTGSQNQFSGDGTVRVVPRLTLAGAIDAFTYALKTGINIRLHDEDFATEAVGSEWTVAAAAGARLLDKRLTIGPEIWFSTVIADGSRGFFKKGSTPLEGIFGAHYQLNDWKLGAGFGPGFTQGLGSPQMRTVLSLEWFPQLEESAPAAPPPPPQDHDRDGISDRDDACPHRSGVRQDDPSENGCPLPPDIDQDGVYDSLDACPNEFGEPSSDPQKNGCPPLQDQDGDGLLDDEDACPAQVGPKNEDPEQNGCPLVDTDDDQIVDEEDACPAQAGPPNEDPKKNGCPEVRIDAGQIKILQRIEFETGKATVREESEGILRAVHQVLSEHPEITKMDIEGHTDNRGSAWLNKKLSSERALAVLSWLAEHGIDRQRLSSSGFGSEKPIDSNETEEGRQNNRRVEFHIESKEDPTDEAGDESK